MIGQSLPTAPSDLIAGQIALWSKSAGHDMVGQSLTTWAAIAAAARRESGIGTSRRAAAKTAATCAAQPANGHLVEWSNFSLVKS
jgi:hypothetical protein